MIYLSTTETRDGKTVMSVTQGLTLSKTHALAKKFISSNLCNKDRKVKLNSCLIQALFQLHINTFPSQDLKCGTITKK